jgi:hypothetical protein
LPQFVLDGASFNGLAGFFTAITRTLGVHGRGTNLDAFNDILRGFGTPMADSSCGGPAPPSPPSGSAGHRRSASSKKLTTCHPANIPRVQADLAAARHDEGQTLFEIITTIIRAHGPGGAESDENVHLILA